MFEPDKIQKFRDGYLARLGQEIKSGEHINQLQSCCKQCRAFLATVTEIQSQAASRCQKCGAWVALLYRGTHG